MCHLSYLNRGGDLDRETYGSAPSWNDCISILGNSLVQLHINDAKGFDASGEGLRLKMGEIPIVDILNIVNSPGRVIQGTMAAPVASHYIDFTA